MEKEEVAYILEEIADLLDLKGENPFKIRAYRNAARALLSLDENLKKIVQEGRLTEVAGIGESIAEKITQLVQKGTLPFYSQLKRSLPRGLMELLQIQNLGPKKVQVLYKKLGIKSVSSLKKAAKAGKISKLSGFGEKSEKNILRSIENRKVNQQRHLWWKAWEKACFILEKLRQAEGVICADIAGSTRRKLETIGDLDFVVASSSPHSVMEWFLSQPFIEKIFAHGDTKSSVMLQGGFKSDIRVVSEEEYPFALLYFTGSKEHNIQLRLRATKRGWSLSEYGLEGLPKAKQPHSEKEIYALFGLPLIPCEIRENLGEFERKIPKLIEEKDLKGTFHIHTTASDGRNTLQEMALAAQELGWEYLGISDHSRSAFQANGLSEERMLLQIDEIHKLNASKQFSLHLFAGVECDILTDGQLDYSESLLKKFDFVIASVHSSLQQEEKQMTKRLIRAIEHPRTTMLGHMSGRLLLQREGSRVNVLKVIDACIANKKGLD